MIGSRIAQHQYRASLDALGRGDLDVVLDAFASSATLSFAGEGPLGADRLSGDALVAWFGRFVRLVPNPVFSVERVAVSGPPWRMRLAAQVGIRSDMFGLGYQNRFAHFLELRWGKVVDDVVIEDTLVLDRAMRALRGRGVVEAAASPIGIEGSGQSIADVSEQ